MVTNSGTEPVTLVDVTIGGTDPSQFQRLTGELTDCAAGTELDPTESCEVRVRFDPSAMGAKVATVTVDSNAPDATIALTGTGIQTALSRSPDTLTFGNRDIDDGPTAVQESTVTNSGTETVDLDAVTTGGANPGDFQQLTNEGTDCDGDHHAHRRPDVQAARALRSDHGRRQVRVDHRRRRTQTTCRSR